MWEAMIDATVLCGTPIFGTLLITGVFEWWTGKQFD